MDFPDFRIMMITLIGGLFLTLPLSFARTTARQYFQTGKTDANETLFTQTSNTLNNIKGYYSLGFSGDGQDSLTQAADDFNKNIDISPKLADAYFLRRNRAFTPGLIPSFINGQIAELSAARFDAMTPAQIGSLSQAQMSAVTNPQFSGLTEIQKKNLNRSQIQGLNMAVINVNALLDDQTAFLTAAQVESISTANFDAMNNAKLKNLAPSAMAGVTNSQFSRLTAAQKGCFSKAQVQGLNMAEINVNYLLDTQTAYLTPDQVGSIPKKNFAVMNDAKMKNLSQSIF